MEGKHRLPKVSYIKEEVGAHARRNKAGKWEEANKVALGWQRTL